MWWTGRCFRTARHTARRFCRSLPLGNTLIRAYEHRIINTFPALLPAFADCDSATLDPYEQALRAGVKLSGATAYFVTTEPSGPIILQQAVEVWEGDTAKTLQRRITEEAEWKLLPRAIALFCQGSLHIEGSVVHIAGGDK